MQQEFTWLSKDEGLRGFAESRNGAVEAYSSFVLSGIGSDDGIDFKGGNSVGILGDELFIERAQNEIKSNADNGEYVIDLETLISLITDSYSVNVEILQAHGIDRKVAHIRSMAALLARETVGVSLRELSDFFSRSDSSMSQASSRLKARIHKSKILKDEYVSLKNELFSVTLKKLSICHA